MTKSTINRNHCYSNIVGDKTSTRRTSTHQRVTSQTSSRNNKERMATEMGNFVARFNSIMQYGGKVAM